MVEEQTEIQNIWDLGLEPNLWASTLGLFPVPQTPVSLLEGIGSHGLVASF